MDSMVKRADSGVVPPGIETWFQCLLCDLGQKLTFPFRLSVNIFLEKKSLNLMVCDNHYILITI